MNYLHKKIPCIFHMILNTPLLQIMTYSEFTTKTLEQVGVWIKFSVDSRNNWSFPLTANLILNIDCASACLVEFEQVFSCFFKN